MAKIRNYVTDNNITDQDIVVGSDGDNSGVTKNFNVATLKTYVSNGLVEEAPINGITYSRKDGNWIASSLSADEIIEVETYANLPSPGAINVLYITLDTGQLWIWDGAYSEINQSNISPLSTITEGGHTGIARTGRNPLYYGDIGIGAVDLSSSTTPSSTYGATGISAFASGRANKSFGAFSHSQNIENNANAYGSSASGVHNSASGIGEMATGMYGTEYTGTDTITDKVFNVGAGTSTLDRKNVFSLFRNLAAKFTPTALSSITNQVAGFFIFDSSDSNRPAVHNGTAWKKLAYQDDVALITIDSIPTDGSSNAVSSNGTFDALALKADLVSGKVPSSQLPSYVDDVVEVANFAALPLTGENGKLYITIDTGFVYRWTGSVYVQIATGGSVTSVGLTMPSAFSVSNSPITSTGDIAVTAAGTTAEYIRGDGTLATLPVVPTKTSDLINDGDNGTSHFISLEDLPSTLTVYPTTVASGIGGYNRLVSSITDPDYNTTAVNVSTGAITGTAQLISGLITDENQIIGNPGIFNMTTIGNIRRTGGSGQAEFFFRVYKRDSGGTETLIFQSNNTQQITSTIYAEFFTSGLWNDGIFVSTDRIVIKFYGTKVGIGSNPTYDFQFGGSNPVRSVIPVPLNVIPSGGSPLTREEFSYTSSQDFTLSGTPSFIYAVFVNGQELKSIQYSLAANILTIVNTLQVVNGLPDEVSILYTQTSSGFLEYYTKAQIDAFNYEPNHAEFVEVNDITDLPTISSGVYNLVGGYTYLFLKHVDLLGGRIVCGQDTVIVGWSSENCSIKSTGLSAATALITSTYSLPIRNISFTHDKVFDLQGDGTTTALDWFGVNLLNCTSGGTIKNYTNFVAGDSALLNSGGFVYDGTIGTVAFSNTLFDTAPGTTAITILPTCTISRRVRIIYSSFVTLSGETGINFDSGATVGDERYILDTVNFSGGGTYISGLSYPSNKTIFSGCIGITNTSTRGFISMINNITYTSTANTALYYKAAGVTTPSSLNSKFSTPSDNNLTYTGAFIQAFIIQINCNVRTSVSTQNINIGIAKNGTFLTESEMTILCAAGSTPSFGATQCVVEMAANDYVELYVRNTSSSNNVMVSDMNFSITKIPV